MSCYLDCVRSQTFCALCYSGVKGRKAYRGHKGWHAPAKKKKEKPWMIARNAAANGSPSKVLSEKSGGSWEKEYPSVVEFLTRSSWEDGSGRLTGTIMIMVESGLWKSWVHDRDASIGAFVSSGTLPGLLKALDKGVETGQLDWRPDRPKGRK